MSYLISRNKIQWKYQIKWRIFSKNNSTGKHECLIINSNVRTIKRINIKTTSNTRCLKIMQRNYEIRTWLKNLIIRT